MSNFHQKLWALLALSPVCVDVSTPWEPAPARNKKKTKNFFSTKHSSSSPVAEQTFDVRHWTESQRGGLFMSYSLICNKNNKRERVGVGGSFVTWAVDGVGRLNRNSMDVPSAGEKYEKNKGEPPRSESGKFFPFQTTWNILLLRSHWNTLFIHFSNFALFLLFILFFFSQYTLLHDRAERNNIHFPAI